MDSVKVNLHLGSDVPCISLDSSLQSALSARQTDEEMSKRAKTEIIDVFILKSAEEKCFTRMNHKNKYPLQNIDTQSLC